MKRLKGRSINKTHLKNIRKSAAALLSAACIIGLANSELTGMVSYAKFVTTAAEESTSADEQVDDKQAENKQAEDKRAEDKQAEDKQVDDNQTENKNDLHSKSDELHTEPESSGSVIDDAETMAADRVINSDDTETNIDDEDNTINSEAGRVTEDGSDTDADSDTTGNINSYLDGNNSSEATDNTSDSGLIDKLISIPGKLAAFAADLFNTVMPASEDTAHELTADDFIITGDTVCDYTGNGKPYGHAVKVKVADAYSEYIDTGSIAANAISYVDNADGIEYPTYAYNAGTYTIIVTVKSTDETKVKSGKVELKEKLVINKIDPEAKWFMPAADTHPYGEMAVDKWVTMRDNVHGGDYSYIYYYGDISFKLYTSSDCKPDEEIKTNAEGCYDVTNEKCYIGISLSGGKNINASKETLYIGWIDGITKATNEVLSASCADISEGETPSPAIKLAVNVASDKIHFQYSKTYGSGYADWDTSNKAGTYYIQATVDGDKNVEGLVYTGSETGSDTFTVNVKEAPEPTPPTPPTPEPGDMSEGVKADGYSGVYDGTEHGISVVLSGDAAGADVKYGTSEGTYELSESPKYKDAGSYTVYYKASKTNYKDVTGSATIVISKAANKVLSASCADINEGETPAPKIELQMSVASDRIHFQYSKSYGSGYADWDTSNKAGTYYIQATVDSDKNVEGLVYTGDETGSDTFTVEVKKEEPEPTPPEPTPPEPTPPEPTPPEPTPPEPTPPEPTPPEPTPPEPTPPTPEPGDMSDGVKADGYSGVYDGTEHGISVVLSGDAAGATVKYGTTEGTYELSESPKYKDAGSYTVYYKASKNDYNDVTGSAVITISKAGLTITADDKTINHGDAAPSYTINYSGFVGSDTMENALKTKAQAACNYVKGNPAGKYTITPSGAVLKADNYNIRYIAGTLTVNAKRDDKGSDSGSGGGGGGSSSGSGSSTKLYGSWVKDSTGWMYVYTNGTKAMGYETTDDAGNKTEHISWLKLDNKWWPFGADAYLKTGWIKDNDSYAWYYSDVDNGMLTGWHYDHEDGRWYYLDKQSGAMLTGWQLIDGRYYYLTPSSTGATWVQDNQSGKWTYDKDVHVKPLGSLYMNELTPDGFAVNADGVWQ